MNAQMVFKFVQVILMAGSNPLVQKFVDNMVAGTPTRVDDWVWKALKAVVLGGSINDLDPSLAEVQREYEADKDEAKKPLPAPIVIA